MNGFVVQDERRNRPPCYVIPSVAEESKNPEMESRSGISDSSATLGMTWEIARPAPYRHSRVSGNPENPDGSMPVFGSALLDSRLRGNDGKGAAAAPHHPRVRRTFFSQVALHRAYW